MKRFFYIQKQIQKMKITIKNKKKSLFLAIILATIVAFPVCAEEITSDDIISLTNQSRTQNNLPSLIENDVLNEVAKEKALDMIRNDYFSHTSPTNVTPWYWFEVNGYEYKYAGENLAINYEDSISQHEAWMNSVTHRENILDPHYQETGAAVVEGKLGNKQVIISVQLFAQPKNQVLIQKYSSIKNNQLLLLANNNIRKERMASADAKYEQTDYFQEQKRTNMVLSARAGAKKNFTKNIIAIAALLLLAFLIHVDILSSLNPKRFHHIIATNTIVILIIFSILRL